MSHRSAMHCCLLTLALVAGLASPIAAQPKPVAAGHGVVDVVSLKSGRSLRGGIAWQHPNGSLTMAVSLDWFRGSNPTRVATVLAENVKQRQAAWTQTRDRITERLKPANDSPRLVFFLKQELERINLLLADRNPAEPDFLWFDVAHQTIAKVSKATSDQQRIALFAWDERLANVETRDGTSLKKELTNKGVKMDGPLPDLLERLPSRPQDDREWGIRMALIEYTLSKPLDFQGMGDNLTRTTEGQPVNLGEVLPKIFQQQLGSLLKDLTNDGRQPLKAPGDAEWLKTAIREAELTKSRGFRATRLELDATTSRTTVETRFVAQVAQGIWQTAWRFSVTEDGTRPRPQAEARIEQDPQLKSAIDTLKSLGLIDANTLQQAIRVGAGTMAAQQDADAKFGEFRDRYTRRLDGPPLLMATGQ